MSEKISSRAIWQWAGIGGLALAAASSAYLFLSGIITQGTTWSGILVFLLDIAKIVGCILIMRWFMIKFNRDLDGVERRDLKKLGTVMALLSAFLFAGVTMANLQLHPETINQAMDIFMQAAGDKLDHNGRAALEEMPSMLPSMTFFTTFIYCFLYGWILSTILSSKICPDNPFANQDNKKEEEF